MQKKLSALDIKQLKVQLKSVDAAKEEMEYRIAERQADIDRLKANVLVQEAKIVELQQKISEGEAALVAVPDQKAG